MIPQMETIRFIGLPDGRLLVNHFPERIAISQEVLDSHDNGAVFGMEVDGDLVLFTVRNGAALYQRTIAYENRIDGSEPAWEYRRVALEMHEAWQ